MGMMLPGSWPSMCAIDWIWPFPAHAAMLVQVFGGGSSIRPGLLLGNYSESWLNQLFQPYDKQDFTTPPL